MAEPSDATRKYREFLDLMPLTLALAGLPLSEHGKYFTVEQIESRLFTLKHAWKASLERISDRHACARAPTVWGCGGPRLSRNQGGICEDWFKS